MGKNRISKTILLNVGLVLAVIMLGVGAFFATRAESGEASNFVLTGEGVGAGDYVTADGAHKISVATDEGGGTTIAYFDTAAPTATYALTASTTTSATGVETITLTGNLGTDSKAATFVMLNENAILCVSHIKYATAGGNVVLYGYTPFVKTYTPTEDVNGVVEVWRNGSKVSTYANFQDAFTAAQNNDTIKLKSNINVTEGAALVGKNLTIEGNHYTLEKSQWANTVFAVAEGAQLTINNLNIDGGATGWAIGFDDIVYAGRNSVIPIAAGSADNDPITNYSAVTSSGKLLTNNLNISNAYSTGSGAAITIAKGEASISNSTFSHLRSNVGGAILVGFKIQEAELSDYTITNVTFNNVDFTNNYAASGGGAIIFQNAKVASFGDCNFDTNAANGVGGALYVDYNDKVYALGLSYPEFNINNSTFYNNWSSRSGAAIRNWDAEIEITNTDFISNMGLGGDKCFGVVDHGIENSGSNLANQIFDNCLFENNGAPCTGISCIGDEGARTTNIEIKNTKFKGNSGSYSVAIYTAVSFSIDSCSFENEEVSEAVLRLAPMYDLTFYQRFDKTTSTFDVKDVEIRNTIGGCDILAGTKKESSHPNPIPPSVNLSGTTTANVDLKDSSNLTVNGTLDGDVICDGSVSSTENINGSGTITGNIAQHYDLTIYYINPVNNENETKTITIEPGTTSSNEIETLLGVSKENHTLVLYTDSGYTNKWDYNCDQNETLYGQWEEGAITINYYDEGAIRFSGTHAAAYAKSHLNGTPTILDAPTRGGYIFEGWYLNDSTCSDESKRVTQLSASQTYTSISLYAKWRVFEQTVTLTCQNYDASAQQFMVYVFIGDELVMQIHPTANMTLTFNRLKNYDKALRICFVYGYYGKIEYTGLTGAKANGRSVNVLEVESVQINYKITTPNVNSSIII